MELKIDKSSILFNGLEEDKERQCRLIMPFNSIAFDDGVQYLCFKIKPNDYKFKHRLWLYEKIEMRVPIDATYGCLEGQD